MKQILKAHESLPTKSETSPTVGDIFRKYGEVFRATHPLHPHVHYIVTAGGINNTGKWVDSKYHATFLFPVKALSTVFRAKFLEGLKKIHHQLKFPDDLKALANPHTFSQWLYHKTPKEWVVFSKPPFSGPEEVVKYIGRYTHRSAISNNRIIFDKDGKIEFWFKNTRKNSRWEITSLPVI